MTRHTMILLFAVASTLAPTTVRAEDLGQKWMTYLKGQWTYTMTVGEMKETGTVTWKLTAGGKAGTGRFAGSDGSSAFELGGGQGDSDSLLVITGYDDQGGYWHLEYTQITPDLRVKGPMRSFGNGKASKGTLTGGRIDDNNVEFHYEGKTAEGERVAWDFQAKRK